MPSKRHERTSARRNAVQVLYTGELQEQPPTALLQGGGCISSEEEPLSDYALTLIEGVERHVSEIDGYLASSSENWSLDRMPVVDRIILRVAVYEMAFVGDVPISVAINEAVDLAKDFGGEDDSPRFVNGVLGRIAKMLEAGEAPDSFSQPIEEADA